MFFRGKYNFLSNFYNCPVQIELNGVSYTFKNSEAAFQAQKNLDHINDFISLSGLEAKKLSKEIELTTADWEHYRLYAMAYVLNAKFKNEGLLLRLKEITEDIEETNYWSDTYWGVCKGVGQNRLGRMLMNIRDNNNDLDSLLDYIKELKDE